jgi:hypothetical protein
LECVSCGARLRRRERSAQHKGEAERRTVGCGVEIRLDLCGSCARSEHLLAHDRKIQALTWRTQELQTDDLLDDVEDAERWLLEIERCDAKLRARTGVSDSRA